ncbi:MAG: hypothetical protein MI748_19005 [Opitutales bacterium]|nr:hypothetical protein [Opitutales bacterium]
MPFRFTVLFVAFHSLMSCLHASEEVTKAEPLDLNEWMSNDQVLDGRLCGSWNVGENRVIEIMSAPFAGNVCFVQISGRMVPGFQIEINSHRYLVLGTHASEDLKLVPQVICFNFAENESVMNVEEVNFHEKGQSFPNPEFLTELILSDDAADRIVTQYFRI